MPSADSYMELTSLEVRVLRPQWQRPLTSFFRTLELAGEARHFHPHDLTAAEAKRLAHYEGRDLYYILVEGKQILGYGMLRGWDEGFDVPSLGIAIHPEARGLGLGRVFTDFLHAAARRRGSTRIRLKVYAENIAAVRLYESLGYRFEAEEAGQLVGLRSL